MWNSRHTKAHFQFFEQRLNHQSIHKLDYRFDEAAEFISSFLTHVGKFYLLKFDFFVLSFRQALSSHGRVPFGSPALTQSIQS
jgi:hypothetical protein